MTVTFDSAKSKITITDKLAKPSASFDGKFMYGHLSEGFKGFKYAGDALTAEGTVPITKASSDQCEFGFVQLARAVEYKAVYAGRTPAEGSIEMDFFLPPVMSAKILLDASNNPAEPFYRPSSTIFASGTPTAKWGDHPGMILFQERENFAVSKVPNFIFKAVMDREFTTILTATVPGDDGKAIRYLAHFEWKLRYDFIVKWKNGTPNVVTNLSTYRRTKEPTLGAPPDADWQPKLLDPTGERANVTGGRAEKLTNEGGPPNKLSKTTPAVGVPSDFWT